jgi:hypothetical protein
MLEFITNWFAEIQDKYSVSPLIFGVIYVLSIAPCWFSIFRIIHYIRNKDKVGMINWMVIFALVFLSPYAYVYFFGRNYSIWFHFIFAIMIALSIISVIRKVKRKINMERT